MCVYAVFGGMKHRACNPATAAGWKSVARTQAHGILRPRVMRPGTAEQLRLPSAPRAIQKGISLSGLLDLEAVNCLAHNIRLVYPALTVASFRKAALTGIETLSLLQRGQHLARVLRQYLPARYEDAVKVLLRSLTPPLTQTDQLGLGVFFYLPHVCFVAAYGLDSFETSMRAQYELTRRFTAEFSIRPFLIRHPERTLERLTEWTQDRDPHVRRLCSEGTRPRLPWAMRIPAFQRDPRPVIPILEALKDDPDRYVRRSVANHLGDIAKDQPALAFMVCRRWLTGANPSRKWVIRHALRYPAKNGVKAALRLRQLARHEKTQPASR